MARTSTEETAEAEAPEVEESPADRSDDPILAARDVIAGYTPDLDILHGVSVDVYPGEVVCIIGPNGAGKSTLMKSIFGLLTPREGDIIFHGEDITGLQPNDIVQKGMCYVPQLDNIFPNLTALENLEMGAWVRTEGFDEALERVYTIFPLLRERQDQKVGKMSGGQRQMVAMGRALMLEPRLLLLDEPSAGLAPNLVDMVFDKVIEIARSGTPILLVEQNAKKALSISDRGYVLDMGQNKYQGPGGELLKDPKVGKLYLGG